MSRRRRGRSRQSRSGPAAFGIGWAALALRLTHIGGPTVLIEMDGWRLLTDPTFDPPGRRYSFGLGTSSRKVEGPALAASELGELDAVLLSHDQHADNLDDAGREPLAAAGTVITTTAGAKRLGGSARGLDDWGSTRLEGGGRPALEVTATPCRHGAPLVHLLSGPVIGFAISRAGEEGTALWISGDTVLYDGVREVALLHLGGVRFPITGPLRYSMTAREGVELCGELKPRVAIPVHYEGWSHFREGRRRVEDELADAPQDVRDRFRWIPIGEATEV
jgi:L-ascorbate metabolism protein UlaG (beta-lactamase superfamily)